ncbi:hypothetical protein KDW67_33980 [Burkholderia cenocepacia]|uniref:hypothetical protein n=1 Tax=Burkholderia cenocepacia TaxID=95486 RepID=UPI00097BC0AC|nr:hypothetical protein [Burkholderia cenocepacia]AQQ46761.1 hypothetical protein A8F32_13250 [Burkholderia cenocepacia]MBR8264987.1 hypothetical protein [Burkholderia cenocepacia]ONI97094.1 hypothetical protein A8F33_33335 [Burkholderia cenocepacia]ONJ01618.1 hypothetical protein A8F53_16565 [Burkholderia cenocepacia]ONJ33946.1 hypothetical protein A8F38_07525 [Burkholderia cenocepacia]
MSLTRGAWKALYETNPILLTGGVAGNLGVPLPLGSLLSMATSGMSSILSLLGAGGGTGPSLNEISFVPGAGTALYQAQNPMYPTADMQTAANASILLPTQVTMTMIMPAQGVGGYEVKSAALAALKSILEQHQQRGGSFTVVHPAYVYTGCLLNQLVDQTSRTKNVATEWLWIFDRPLVAEESALGSVLNGTMQAITNGVTDLSGKIGTLADNVGGSILQNLF